MIQSTSKSVLHHQVLPYLTDSDCLAISWERLTPIHRLRPPDLQGEWASLAVHLSRVSFQSCPWWSLILYSFVAFKPQVWSKCWFRWRGVAVPLMLWRQSQCRQSQKEEFDEALLPNISQNNVLYNMAGLGLIVKERILSIPIHRDR